MATIKVGETSRIVDGTRVIRSQMRFPRFSERALARRQDFQRHNLHFLMMLVRNLPRDKFLEEIAERVETNTYSRISQNYSRLVAIGCRVVIVGNEA